MCQACPAMLLVGAIVAYVITYHLSCTMSAHHIFIRKYFSEAGISQFRGLWFRPKE